VTEVLTDRVCVNTIFSGLVALVSDLPALQVFYLLLFVTVLCVSHKWAKQESSSRT
jgi:hypothetical protein